MRYTDPTGHKIDQGCGTADPNCDDLPPPIPDDDDEEDDEKPESHLHEPSDGTVLLVNYKGLNFYQACGSNFLTESISPEWGPTICTQTETYELTADATWDWNNEIYNWALKNMAGADPADVIFASVLELPLEGMGVASQMFDVPFDLADADLAADTMTMGGMLNKAGENGANVTVVTMTNMYVSRNGKLPPAMSDGTLDFTFTPKGNYLSLDTGFIVLSPNFKGYAGIIIPRSGVGSAWHSLIP